MELVKLIVFDMKQNLVLNQETHDIIQSKHCCLVLKNLKIKIHEIIITRFHIEIGDSIQQSEWFINNPYP